MNKYMSNVVKVGLRTCGLACLMSVGACASDDAAAGLEDHAYPSAEAEKSMNLLARVELPSGSVRFYETEPGTILEVESGLLDAPHPSEPAGLGAVQRYEFLAGERAPKALVDASLRAGVQQSAQVELVDQPGVASAIEKTTGTTTLEWFRANYCAPTDRNWGTPEGKTWGGDSSFSARVQYMKAGAFTVLGHVNYRMGYAGGSIPDQYYGVPKGYFVGFRQTSSINRDALSYVRDANGTDNRFGEGTVDKYVHCLNYHY